jgi:hypothetical protein
MFRQLTKKEEAAYRAWARANYTRLEPINGVWHPVIQNECSEMNTELVRKDVRPPA